MSITVINPYDLSKIETLTYNTEKEIEASLQTAFDLWKQKKLLPKIERIQILERLSQKIKSNVKSIAMLATSEGGKALKDSIIEIERAALGVDHAIAVLKTSHGEMIPMGGNASSQNKLAFTVAEPVGPVLAISAFNHPFNLIVHQVVPAVAVGAPILIRPASTTPLSCRLLLNMLYEAGLPKEYAKMILCSRENAEKLVSDSRLRFFSFIGSSKVGWHLKQKLQPYVHATMEHGGVAPAVVWKDADIDAILPGLVKASYYHAGQVCVSLQKLIVHEDVYTNLKEKFVAAASKLKVGNPALESTDYGPLISVDEKKRVLEWLQEVKGNIILGGSETTDNCISPTVVENPDRNAKVSTKEIFAPMVALYKCKNKEEALSIANSQELSFQSSIYTRDMDTALAFIKAFDCKTALINENPAFRVDWMPFGGTHHSGFGVGGIPYTMKDYTFDKQIIIQSKEIHL
jgi:acyl-CoA reductase-like NAD-dependent aldehyde dehydrogenase